VEPTPEEDTEPDQSQERDMVYHAFVEVQTGNGIARAERLQVRLHGKKNGYDLYGRHVIDYGSAESLFNPDPGL
jgi:hypothetical protein